MAPNSPTYRTPTALRWIGDALALVALSFALLAAIVLIVIPRATGSQTYTVLTSSMAPGYPPGTFVVVRPTPVDQLRTGDVITYQLDSGRPAVVTHRIIGFATGQNGERRLVTKGDNNDTADAPVRPIQVRGKLFYAVPYVGFVANAIGHTDRGLAVVVLAVVLIAAGLALIVIDLRKMRSARSRSAAGAGDAGEPDASDRSVADASGGVEVGQPAALSTAGAR